MHQAARPLTRIGPYELLEPLGSGAMGDVYRAREDGEDRSIALKVLHPHLLHRRNFFRRFQHEALAGSAVHHPNVVSTFDAGFHVVDGVTWCVLAMEHVEGRTLRTVLEELGALPQPLWLEIAKRITAGLVAIHDAGIVHRDLKPENVLITPEHEVKIMDLGVARLLDRDLGLTGEGQFIGSLPYAAPEQLRGEAAEPATDLYALGVLLRELATGENFFLRENPTAVLQAHLGEEPPDLLGAVEEIEPWCAAVSSALLAKQPRDRLPTACLLGQVLAEGASSRWWREHRAALLEARRQMPCVPVARETGFHGRRDELLLLRRSWAKARRGVGGTVLLVGEAGIGKSRLVDVFLESVDGRGARVLYGGWSPSGGVDALVGAVLGALGPDDLEVKLRDFMPRRGVLASALASWLRHEPQPADSMLGTRALHTVLVDLIQGMASDRPLLWVVEDMHFATSQDRQLLFSLARALEGRPILLLLTTRPGPHDGELVQLARLGNVVRTTLGRLEPNHVAGLLRDALHSPRLVDRLSPWIFQKSDGVPYFVFELVRALKDQEILTPGSDGSWVVAADIEDVRVPPTVRELIADRLRGLSSAERAVLEAGAVQGDVFDPDLVARMLGRPRIQVLQHLAAMERRSGAVRSRARTTRFDHHLIREVLYTDLTPSLREGYHLALAEALEHGSRALEREPGELEGATSVQLCEHFLGASRATRARRYVESALDHLQAAFRNEAAIALARRVLAEPGLLGGSERAHLLLRMNGCLDPLGAREAQAEVLEEACTLVEVEGERELQAKAQLAYGTLLLKMDRYEEARALLERAAALAHETENLRVETDAMGNLGGTYRAVGRLEDAMRQYERCLAISTAAGDRLGESKARGALGYVFRDLGRPGEAGVQWETRLGIVRELGDRHGEARLMGNLGETSMARGRFDEAGVHFGRSLTMSREVGNRQEEAFAHGSLGLLDRLRGHYGTAKTHLEQFLSMVREIFDRAGEMTALTRMGDLWRLLGQTGRAHVLVDDALVLARKLGSRFQEGDALRSLTVLADEVGNVATALDLGLQTLGLRREIGHGRAIAVSLKDLAVVYWRSGDQRAARHALDEATERYRRQQDLRGLAKALALRAAMFHEEVERAETALWGGRESADTPNVRYHLWKATGKHEHLAEAKRLLDYRVEHAPAEYRESMLANVRLNREIMAAWREHGGDADG